MEFRVLGNLETWAGCVLPPLRPRQERLLARLLLTPNTFVSIGALAEALWDGEPPDSAERQVQNAASQLRQAWQQAGVPNAKRVIHTARGGYRLEIALDQLDLYRFRDLVSRATVLKEAGDVTGAARTLREALALWRGPAFAGIRSGVIEADAARINEERHVAWEECVRLELRLGRHGRVLTELVGLVAEFPFREQLTGLLMLALYRSGRQKDALRAYQETRARLGEELGIDPGPNLRELHEQVLRNDPALDAPVGDDAGQVPAVPARLSGPPPPMQIPPRVGYFTGRGGELGYLGREVGKGPVIAVTGAAGMGKTSLVVEWAHRVRDRFPDGQIFLDLRGHLAGSSRSPSSVLQHVLESLQLPPQRIPGALEKQIPLYRSVISDRSVLIILDNAGSIDQVLPVLPVGDGSQLVVTSRRSLAALNTYVAVSQVTISPLNREESFSLLAEGVTGRSPVSREDPAAQRLVDLCGGMPLALRILAARLISESFLTLGDLVAELTRAGAHLDGFVVDGDTRSVRSVLASAYAVLPQAEARVFRLLAVHPGSRFRPELVATLAGVPLPAARRTIASLVASHLVSDLGGHLAMHDLVRSFAEECLQQSAKEDRPDEALDRLVSWYLSVAGDVAGLLRPDRNGYADVRPTIDTHLAPFRDKMDAIESLNGERENLAAVTSRAVGHDIRRAIQLIYHLHSYFVRSGFPGADVEAWKLCLEKAQDVDDSLMLGHLCHALGGALAVSQELTPAIEHLHRSAELYESEGYLDGAAGARLGIGWALGVAGRLEEALEQDQLALALAQEADNVTLTVHALNNSADTLVALGETDAGLDRLETALKIAQKAGEDQHEALILSSMGEVSIRRGEYRTALEYLHQALDRLRRFGFRTAEAETLMRIGMAMRGCGEPEEARSWLRQALSLYRDSNDAAGESAVLELMAAPAGDNA
ncbi:BTAD domain-containing putative transcriptional regulator [Micromonospora matsumotoense]|uniref:AfsR/SARP family transcriptional regulator n=1 Tax=Micromonospora matsumotoense TaxID=121616 RepID=UPI0033C3F88C